MIILVLAIAAVLILLEVAATALICSPLGNRIWGPVWSPDK